MSIPLLNILEEKANELYKEACNNTLDAMQIVNLVKKHDDYMTAIKVISELDIPNNIIRFEAIVDYEIDPKEFASAKKFGALEEIAKSGIAAIKSAFSEADSGFVDVQVTTNWVGKENG